MKKLIMMLIFLSVIKISHSQKKFDLTFIASPQVSWLTSDSKYISRGKNLLGFGYGVEGDIFLRSDSYMIVTGLTVSTVGGSLVYNTSIPFRGKVLPAGTTIDYFLTNLEIPLAMKMRTRHFNRTCYYAQFGLTNWLNLKTKATSNENGASSSMEPVKNEIRFYNLGLNVGIGLEYDLGHGNALTGGIIYSAGFLDSTKNSGINDETTLNVIRFRVGFVF